MTTSGSSAATAPFRVISDVSRAERRQIVTRTRDLAVPAFSSSRWPAQVVTPVESMPSLTTNRVAMKMTTGSPKPATASSVETSPVAQRPSAARIATAPTGSRFHTNRATTTPSTTSAVVASSIGKPSHGSRRRYSRWTGEPGPHGMPMTYQPTKNRIQVTSTTTV